MKNMKTTYRTKRGRHGILKRKTKSRNVVRPYHKCGGNTRTNMDDIHENKIKKLSNSVEDVENVVTKHEDEIKDLWYNLALTDNNFENFKKEIERTHVNMFEGFKNVTDYFRNIFERIKKLENENIQQINKNNDLKDYITFLLTNVLNAKSDIRKLTDHFITNNNEQRKGSISNLRSIDELQKEIDKLQEKQVKEQGPKGSKQE
jgi:predicted  nucleic acid-binding Zn-ribbon protein